MAVNQGDPVTLSFSTVIEGKTYRTDVTVRTAPAAQEAPAEPPAPAPAPAPAPGTLSAVITLGRKSYTAAESAAKDLGDFSSPIGGIVQRCLRADIPELNMTVFFRPDRDGRRDEVVFELGRLFVDQAAVPAALGAYTAQVYRGSQLLARVDVPAHYWHSRWRWQSAPRPVVGDARALISSGLLPPLSQAAPAVPYAASYKAVPYEVMGLAGVTPYMPQTGERPDIGLVTAYQADYICTGSGQALAVTLAQGEASGTVPWHQRDEVTGAPIDFAVHTKASWYSDSRAGAPWIKGSPGASATPDNAHTPALAYVPYVLTGDPYMLEELQFMANNTWGSEPMGYRPNVGQSRAFAWSMRTIGQAARVTPASVPSWLLPQAYWKGMLDRHRAHVEANYVGGAGPLLSVFRSTCPIDNSREEGAAAPGGTWIDVWQEEFIVAVVGWLVRMGHAEWRKVFDWKVGSTIARCSGTAGWPRAVPAAYRTILRPARTAPMAASWAEAWAVTQRTIPAYAGVALSDQKYFGTDMTYLAYSRGALVMAEALGTPGAAEALSWATRELVARGWRTDHKWRLGAGI